MNKTKILGILVGILTLINIGLLIFIFMGRPKGPGPGGFGNKAKAELFLQKEFGFDAQQMSLFKESKESHIESSRELQSQLDDLSRSLYTGYASYNNEVRDSMLKEISVVSEKIYMNNVNHFEEVRAICTPDQLPKMERFIQSLLRPKI